MKDILIVTGLSGAGRTTAMRALEDIGYATTENPPLTLLEDVIVAIDHSPIAIAISVDQLALRLDVLERFYEKMTSQSRANIRIIFLECREDVMLQRFSETRRRHPLSRQDVPLLDALAYERQILQPIRDLAARVIDTSDLTPHELRADIQTLASQATSRSMVLTIISFGFRNGLPSEADFVFDIRQLRNPHWDRDLRDLTGFDPRVRSYVRADPLYDVYVTHIMDLLKTILPGMIASGKPYCCVGIGCTGGKHRSVTMALDLGGQLKAIHEPVVVSHKAISAPQTS